MVYIEKQLHKLFEILQDLSLLPYLFIYYVSVKPYIFISHHRSYSCSMVIIYFIAHFASGSPF